jgi:hypothetical protein
MTRQSIVCILVGLVLAIAICQQAYAKTVPRQNVVASCFDDATGNHDNNLYDGGYYYAELSTNYKARPLDYCALGCLPNDYRLRITYRGKSIFATKGDVGAGGPSHPKIDIHLTAAKALGFRNCDDFGIRTVTIESA